MGVKWRSNTSLGVWLICQNPDCSNTDNSDHTYLVPFRLRDRKYCSRSCSVSMRNATLSGRLASSNRLKLTWKNNESYRQARIDCIVNYIQSEDGKNQASERLIYKWKDPEFRKRKSLFQSVLLKNMWKDPGTRSRFIEASRVRMLSQVKEGKFGRCQGLLFEELNKRLPGYFYMEKVISINQEIRDKYQCKNQYYRIDISYVIENQILLAVEVDGSLGHSTYKEKQNDIFRDFLLFEEFKIPTMRITNEEVILDLDWIASRVEDNIRIINNQLQEVD